MPEIRVCVTQQQDTTASVAEIRQHRVRVDRPVAKGGSDTGPMGGELLLASIGGCFMSNLIAAATARGVAARDLSVQVAGEVGGTPPRFHRIQLTVSGAGLERSELEKLATIAERGCVVANTLKGTTEIQLIVG
ncbi:MAG TPA: OsmC family protein [Deferrisomatales bacterium]|nr:OsmC family protein [Deferrisomatales bacterium]